MGTDPRALTESVGDGIRALATGEWSQWEGLVAFPDERVVEEALGQSVDASARSGMLGGSPTFFRRYPPAAGAPRGITVWFEEDTAVVIEIRDAIPANGVELDEPDATLESEFGSRWSQDVHATHGLVLHRRGDDVALLYGIKPCTVEDWMADPLRHSGPPTRRASTRRRERSDDR